MSRMHAGIRYTIIKNAYYCKRCAHTIESTHRRDYKECPCGAVGIDGGLDSGATLSGNPADMETRCVYMATVNGQVQYLDEHTLQISAHPPATPATQ